MRCKQQRRRRTGALRPGTSFPAVSSPSITRPKKNRPNRKKIEERSFEELLINLSETKNAASDGNLTSRTSSDVQSVSVEETKARKIHKLKALILDLEKTDNAIYEQVIERKKKLDFLYASRRQLKQQEANIQHSRDEIVDVLEGLKKEERALLIKVKQVNDHKCTTKFICFIVQYLFSLFVAIYTSHYTIRC